MLLLVSCDSKPERPAPILTADRIAAANALEQQNTQVASGTVQHYYCTNNCAGSGGDSAGTCPTCGLAYEHNQAWHNQAQTPVTTTNTNGISTGVGAVPPTQSTPEPAQNAAGVWHYTCPNGHANGAGSAVPCGECGTTLVHNSLYHS